MRVLLAEGHAAGVDMDRSDVVLTDDRDRKMSAKRKIRSVLTLLPTNQEARLQANENPSRLKHTF